MSFRAAIPLATVGSQPEAPQSSLLHLALLVTAAAVAWALEVRRRKAAPALEVPIIRTASAPISSLTIADSGCPRCSRLLPEVCGFVLCCLVAGGLLWCAAVQAARAPAEDEDVQRIRAEWPLLGTADSLLGFHAMVRLLFLTSAVLRSDEALGSPFGGLPVTYVFMAAGTRAALLLLSPQDVYHVDGPLGGSMNLVLQAGSFLLACYLVSVQVRQDHERRWAQVLMVAISVPLLVWLAVRNRLALAPGPGFAHLDSLFSLVELLELATAVAFLCRTVQAACEQRALTSFALFAHIVLPLQQLSSTYFLLSAWGGAGVDELQVLVGAGRPFEVLQLGGTAQVVAYAIAGAAQLVLGGEVEKHCSA